MSDTDSKALEGLKALISSIVAETLKQARVETPDDPLLTVPQAAARAGMGQSKFRLLVKAGFIKRAPGGVVRVRQSEVDAYGKPEKSK